MKVGVIIPLHAPQQGPNVFAPTYAEVKAVALTAEREGLDSAWITDHLIFRMPPDFVDRASHEAFTIWAGIAEATSRIELGAMVLCTAFRNPTVMAKEAVSLDAVAGHRIILGVGCGWHEPEFKAFGIPFTHRVSMFEEAMSIIRPLLAMAKSPSRASITRQKTASSCRRMTGRAGSGPDRIQAAADDGVDRAICGPVEHSLVGRCRRLLGCGREAGCRLRADGRNPATLIKTAGVMIEFAAEVPAADSYDPARVVKGPVEHVAEKLRTYADAGCAHAICFLVGLTPEKTEMLAEASRKAGLTARV